MSRYEDKTIVYVNSPSYVAEKCEITGHVAKESSTGQFIYILHSLDSAGTFGATEDCVFATKEDAIKADAKKHANRVEKFKLEIVNLKDLIKFPLKYNIGKDEYADYDAQTAYRVRAYELTGIAVNGNEVSLDQE